MNSPLYSALGGGNGGAGFARMMQDFNRFRRQITGDPKQIVMQMVQSGKISQEQLNVLQNTARQFVSQMQNYT